MKFKSDFLAEDYSMLCWFQTRFWSTVLAVLLALAFSFTIFSFMQNILIAICIYLFLAPMCYWIQKLIVIRRADRRFGAFGASSELYLEIDDDEIRQTSAKGETRLPWADVYSVAESKDCYYVFLTKRKAFYFPKRSFENEEHKALFIDYIKKYVPENKIKIKG